MDYFMPQDSPEDQLLSITDIYTQGHFQQALSMATKMLKRYPNSFTLHNIAGASNAGLKCYNAAVYSYKKALKIDPESSEAYNNMGNALNAKGDTNAAIKSYKYAIKIRPDYSEAFNNMGIALKGNGDLAAAVDSYKKAIKVKPNFAEAHNNMGNALFESKETDASLDSYKHAIRIKPDYADAYNNMGVALNTKGDIAEAIESYKQAIKIKPDFTEAFYNMGISLNAMSALVAAIECYDRVIAIEPNHVKAYFSKGNALAVLGKLDAGIQNYEMALSINPNYQAARANKLHYQARICDWKALKKDQHFIAKLGTSTEAVGPFSILPLEDAPERHRLRADKFSKITFTQTPLPLRPRPSQKPKRLRIGYFSADFRNHPVMYALIEILERHNRELFEVYAYAYGGDSNDEMRHRTIKAVDVFDNVRDMNDRNVALLARQDEIDIAIDLTGHTNNSRTGIFAYGAAPIQINAIGYPGTLGASFIDYMITDQTAIPVENQKFLSEKPIYLPFGLCALETNIPLLTDTPTRSKLGLPEEGFVFCAINNTYKITPVEFDIWMRLLQHTEGSVLWLVESNKWARRNLIKEAEARGVDANRLVFQPMMVKDSASQQQYLSQFKLADLYLDTFIYGAGSSACNALWAGLPVITLIGKGITARMAASYLNSIDLPELITTTAEEYEKLALSLSKNSERLILLKQKLADAVRSSPLFNNSLQTKYIEKGYQQAYQRYFDNKPPEAIFVPKDQ